MSTEKTCQFMGFSSKTFEFLKGLKANNNKQWFEENRDDYQVYLIKPLEQLVMDLSGVMLSIDPQLHVQPSVGSVISRIHRDIRFSKDKSPYKSSMWITFKRNRKDWQDAPTYFFEVSEDSYRFGMGYYSASKDTMDKLRMVIDTDVEVFDRMIDFFYNQDRFVIEGDRYKKAIGVPKGSRVDDWYHRKNVYLVCNRKLDQRLFSSDFVRDLTEGFNMIAPLYRFLLGLHTG